MRGSAVAAAAAAVLAVFLVACAGRQATPPATPPSEATPTGGSPSPLPVWIAVFRSADDPNHLEDDAEGLMERAGTAVVVAPEGCFGGLRGQGDVRAGEYVLAVTADSREELEAAVSRSEREPVVTARVEDLCPV
ncbi:MAG: hypothetical protein ACRDIX_06580 [Actinomycetota bacterium]